ncbi:MAG: glycosyltransferase family 4 protein [Gemmatales bacterium]|nr:glycosyltransferase family 4 protein [Gemmatales bacterium]MDW7995913.1 glycosyltransferase family 4 protein [Gemmatales bacterium]
MPSLVFVMRHSDGHVPWLWLNDLAQGLVHRGWSVTLVTPRRPATPRLLLHLETNLVFLDTIVLDWPRLRQWRQLFRKLDSPIIIQSCDLHAHVWSRLYPPHSSVIYLSLYLDLPPRGNLAVKALRYLHRYDNYICSPFANITKRLHDSGIPQGKLAVLPLGMRQPRAPSKESSAWCTAQQLPKASKLIVALVHFQPASQVKTVLWALDILRYAYPQVHLVALGLGDKVEPWVQFSHHLHLDDFVTLLETLEESISWLAAADIIWVTADVPHPWFFVGAGQLFAKPVIAFDSPLVRELIIPSENGFLVPANDPVSLARQTLLLLENRDLADHIIQHLEHCGNKHLDFDNCLNALEQLYHAALSRHSS